MGKIEGRLWRKMLEDPGPRSPAPLPPWRGAPYRASEVTEENRLAVTKELRDRQDKISGTTAVLRVAEEEPGARTSSGKSPQQQGPPGTRASSGESLQQRKTLEEPGPRTIAPPPLSRGATYEASEVTAENRRAVTEALRDRQDNTSGAMTALLGAGEEPGARASSGESLQQQGPPGTGDSSVESF